MDPKLTDFARVIMSDESWFVRYYPREWVWAAPRDNVLHQIKQKMTSKRA
jgi:hypothetical protein